MTEGTDIPVELGIGPITQEDKYKAYPILQNILLMMHTDKDVGIPTLIKNQARKFIK
jgi:uncharacterized protein YbaR (Trm112 family)